MSYIVFLIAILPSVALSYYMYRKDKYAPEPKGMLKKAFYMGVLSIFVSSLFSIPLSLMTVFTNNPQTVEDAFRISFFGAAIPEELAKFLMLWFFLKNNKNFDEKVDGIVYASFVSLGFAALENIMYLFTNYDNFVTVGIVRALFSVPGHFCFGIMMGYFFSLAKFYKKNRTRNMILTLVAPILAHGIFDSILFSINVSKESALILVFAFLAFCPMMWAYASSRIKEHLKRDLESTDEYDKTRY